MRWLCNENIPRNLVEELRRRGHDTAWIRERSPGIADAEVLAIAIRERRICLTFDKDFGELVAAAALPADWAGNFSVLEPGRVRMRPLGRLR